MQLLYILIQQSWFKCLVIQIKLVIDHTSELSDIPIQLILLEG